MDDRLRKAEELLEERARNAQEQQGSPADLQSRVDELVRDLQRERADFANYRRRNESERAEFARFAKADLVRRLLDVLDDFDRALASLPEDLAGQPWVEGVTHVERKLRDILTAEGLEEVGSLGKPFDPYLHEAIAHVEDPTAPEGTVVDEVRKAYRLHDRVIRPALVTVAKAPSEAGTEGPTQTNKGPSEE